MRLFSVEPTGFLYTVLLLFGGWFSFQPSKQVVIQTPGKTVHEKAAPNERLFITLKNGNTVSIVLRPTLQDSELTANRNEFCAVYKNPKVSELEKTFDIVDKIGAEKLSYDFFVYTSATNNTEKNFKPVIEALRAKGITRFKLITNPEQK